jgi:hypothetical protein
MVTTNIMTSHYKKVHANEEMLNLWYLVIGWANNVEGT